MTALVALVLFAMALGTFGWMAVRSTRRADEFWQIARSERLRHEWETAQDLLQNLVTSHQLSRSSEAYRRLHKVQEAVAENPVKYDRLALVFRRELLRSGVHRRFEAEEPGWPQELRGVLLSMSLGTKLLVDSFSSELLRRQPLRWFLFRYWLSITPTQKPPRALQDSEPAHGVELGRAARRLRELAART